jgi:CelD/BcsL family acetyltransferase involved in cellulose biosynthesis
MLPKSLRLILSFSVPSSSFSSSQQECSYALPLAPSWPGQRFSLNRANLCDGVVLLRLLEVRCWGRWASLRIVTIREIPEDENLRQSWNELVQHVDAPEVFYTYEWALAVQRAYSSSFTPLIFLFYDADCLTGVAALATGARESQAFFLTASTADYCDLMSRPERRQEIVESTLGELSKYNINSLILANLPADSATSAVVRQSATRSGFHLHLRNAYLCGQVVLGSSEQRNELKREVNRKKVYRRGLRDMAKLGFEVVHHRKWSEIEPCLPAFYDTQIARFRAMGRVSNLESPDRRKFLDTLSRELSKSEWLVLSSLRLNGVAIAWNYGFRFQGCWFWYQPTFDSNYENLSPGLCLLGKIIEQSCDLPDVRIVDLGLGAEGYKARFATKARQTLHATLNRSWTSHTRTALRHRASTLAKKSPSVEKTIRKSIRMLSRIPDWFRWKRS